MVRWIEEVVVVVVVLGRATDYQYGQIKIVGIYLVMKTQWHLDEILNEDLVGFLKENYYFKFSSDAINRSFLAFHMNKALPIFKKAKCLLIEVN